MSTGERERRFRAAIIGCGPRAHQHAEALRRLEVVELAGAADLDAERLGSFCDRWEIEARCASAAELLEATKPDLVTLVTRPEPKAALVEECAAAGVPVINIEKFAAYTLAEMDRMREACDRAGSLLTVNHQMRFMPQFRAVHDLVVSGRLGEVTFVRAGSRGHLTEQGSHVMDQMLFMNGDAPAEWVLGQADGREGYDRPHPAPGTACASLRFQGGARGAIECGMLGVELDPPSGFWLQKFVEVTGTRGWAGAYVNRGWRAVLDSGDVLSGPGTWEPNWPAQAELFRAALEGIGDPAREHPCRAEAAARGMEALLAICLSALERRAVPLPLDRSRDMLRELEPMLGPGLPVPGSA